MGWRGAGGGVSRGVEGTGSSGGGGVWQRSPAAHGVRIQRWGTLPLVPQTPDPSPSSRPPPQDIPTAQWCEQFSDGVPREGGSAGVGQTGRSPRWEGLGGLGAGCG